MSGPERIRLVDVVVWRPDGEAVAAPAGLARAEVRLDSEHALEELVSAVAAAVHADVALLWLGSDVAHFEVLDLDGALPLAWQAPTQPVGGTAAWNRLGWLPRTRDRIESLLSETTATVRKVVQVKHWSISAVLRVETTQGTFWWKEVPDFMGHEGRLMRWLAERTGGHGRVPDVVAAGDGWSLCRPFPPPSEAPSAESPFELLAELQVATVSADEELTALGCPDRRLEVLVRDLAALAERDDVGLSEERRGELTSALPRVETLVDQLLSEPVPPATLVHGDLHAGNWTRDEEGRWLIFDWTDGCVAHPFMDLGVLPSVERNPEVRSARLESYLRPWRRVVGDEASLDRALAVALPLAAAFQALSYVRIMDGLRGSDRTGWTQEIDAYLTRLLQAGSVGFSTA